ncbi:MAG: hypothetical protein FWF73_08130 [Spirochaetes bacterium]|nr:hypothetical protein [Spirochaetota bacterium]
MNKKIILALIIYFFQITFVNASLLEELDKPPEGAHEGQMLIGCFGSIGSPYGNTIDSEYNFLTYDIYVFTESGITKEFLITHLSYDFGVFFEYMPIDYVGIKSKLKKVYIVQRTLFGSDYQNWNEPLYNGYSFHIGPSIHFINRKWWDISLTPMIGYSIAKYNPTPIAGKIKPGYSGTNKRDVNGIVYGGEINFSMYFSGGLYISAGVDVNQYPLSFSPEITLVNPDTSRYTDMSSGFIRTINFVVSVGYAFSH